MTLREKVERALVEFGVYHDDAGAMACVVTDVFHRHVLECTTLQDAYNVIRRFLDYHNIELYLPYIACFKRPLPDGRIERLHLDEAEKIYLLEG